MPPDCSCSINWPTRKLGSYLVDTYEWDPLAARSVWAFGPAVDGPNVLLDDTLAGEVDKGLLQAVRDSIVQVGGWVGDGVVPQHWTGTTGVTAVKHAAL